MSQSWINFARSGDPSQPTLRWPAYDPQRIPTMVFDEHLRVELDPSGAASRMVG